MNFGATIEIDAAGVPGRMFKPRNTRTTERKSITWPCFPVFRPFVVLFFFPWFPLYFRDGLATPGNPTSIQNFHAKRRETSQPSPAGWVAGRITIPAL
jgi:hypothetical protein